MIAAILGEVDEGIIFDDLPSFLSNNKAIQLAVVFWTSAYNAFRGNSLHGTHRGAA